METARTYLYSNNYIRISRQVAPVRLDKMGVPRFAQSTGMSTETFGSIQFCLRARELE